MKDMSTTGVGKGYDTRQVISVLNQINKKIDLGEKQSKKLSSRAGIHKSALQMHEGTAIN